MPSKFRSWLYALRAQFLIATILPISLGTAIAWSETGQFNPELYLLALAVGSLIHIGVNLANDYFDHRSGSDVVNQHPTPFSGGSRVLPEATLTPREVGAGAAVFFTAGSLLGLYFVAILGLPKAYPLLIVGLAGVFSGVFYSAPPIKASYRGFGELLESLNLGIFEIFGGFYLQAQTLSPTPFVVGIPVSLLATCILYINEFQDYEADGAVGRRNIIVLLGRETAFKGYVALLASGYVALVAVVVGGFAPTPSLLALLTVPVAVKAVRHARIYHSNPEKLIPANAYTAMTLFASTALLTLGFLLPTPTPASWLPLALVLVAATVVLVAMDRKVEALKLVLLGEGMGRGRRS